MTTTNRPTAEPRAAQVAGNEGVSLLELEVKLQQGIALLELIGQRMALEMEAEGNPELVDAACGLVSLTTDTALGMRAALDELGDRLRAQKGGRL